MTETKVIPQRPPDGLLVLCDGPAYVQTKLVRDIKDNWISADTAFNACAARMRCLAWWITTANHEKPAAECKQLQAASNGR